MPTRPFSDLYDYVLPYVPSAEPRLVDFHIRRVTREFCRRTTLWRRRVELVTTPGVEDYILSPYDAAISGGGGGGGVGGWFAVNDQTAVTVGLVDVTTSGSASVTLQETGGLFFESSSIFGEESGLIGFRITIDPPAPIRLIPSSFYESSTLTINAASRFSFDDGVGTEVFNTADIISDGINYQQEYLPSPITLGEATPVSAVTYLQGLASETGTYVNGVMNIEVFAGGSEPDICDPYSILTVALDGKRIDPIGESDRKPYGARPNLAKPKAWFQPSARVLHLYPAPDAAYPVVVDIVCALTMEPTLDVMPEFLIADYREVIADGVVASLKQLNGKPWFDPEGAREFAMRFRNSTQAIRSRLRDAYRPGSFVARGPTFGR